MSTEDAPFDPVYLIAQLARTKAPLEIFGTHVVTLFIHLQLGVDFGSFPPRAIALERDHLFNGARDDRAVMSLTVQCRQVLQIR